MPPPPDIAATARLRAEMDLLSAIEKGEIVSQLTLTQKVGVSLGMVNALVKRAVGKGYAKMRQAPYKRYAYYLTPQGFTEKSRLVAEYLETSLDFFRTARGEYEAIFLDARWRAAPRILLVGEGELAEIAMLAAMAQGRRIAGLLCAQDAPAAFDLARIAAPNPGDLIIVTDQAAPQAAYERAAALAAPAGAVVIAPSFLRITPNRDALIRQLNTADQNGEE